MTRILVTGSRTYDDAERVEEVLSRFRDFKVTLVHGGCPTGADALCDALAVQYGWERECHPADWRTHGRGAGPIRNSEMAMAGADICLAFPTWCDCGRHPNKHYSHGTSDMIHKAVKRFIKTRVFLPRT